MPLYPLPPTTDFITTGETKGTFKGALSGLRAFLNSLLGSSGSQADALTALGSLINGTASKASTYTVVATDRGKLIDCSGTFDLAIDAIATLAPSGAGFSFAVRNGGTGIITINPNLSETINGAATLQLGPFESCVITIDATAAGWLAILTGGGGGSTGQLAYFAMSTPPAGWLKANGALVSRTSYAALFAKIGTTFGAGDGSTTFALPDARGEFLRGWDDARGVDSGRVFGSAQAGDVQSHTHTVTAIIQDPHSQITSSGTPATTGPWIGTATTAASGGTETRPRNLAALACIKY